VILSHTLLQAAAAGVAAYAAICLMRLLRTPSGERVFPIEVLDERVDWRNFVLWLATMLAGFAASAVVQSRLLRAAGLAVSVVWLDVVGDALTASTTAMLVCWARGLTRRLDNENPRATPTNRL
jgi:hypothetical protein